MAGVKGKSGRKANEKPFRHILLEKLDMLDPITERKRMFNVAEKLIEEAENGEAWAVKEIMDRIDGKPKQESDVNTNIKGTLRLEKEIVRPKDAGS